MVAEKHLKGQETLEPKRRGRNHRISYSLWFLFSTVPVEHEVEIMTQSAEYVAMRGITAALAGILNVFLLNLV